MADDRDRDSNEPEVSQLDNGFWGVAGLSGYYSTEEEATRVAKQLARGRSSGDHRHKPNPHLGGTGG